MDEQRIGDVDREAAVHQLGEHYALGRLDKDEYDERCDAVWSAKTRGDLAPLFVDLPGGVQGTPRAKVPDVGRGPRQGPPAALVAVVLVLLAATVILKVLPLLLVAVVIWFVFARGCFGGRARSGHAHRT